VARHYRHPLLIFVVSDEPDVDERLGAVLTRLTGRHDVMWAMVSDMPAVASAEDEQDGFDVTSGRFVLSAAAVGPKVIAAYQYAEEQRRERLSEFMTLRGVPHATIAGSTDIRTGLIAMTGVFARAG